MSNQTQNYSYTRSNKHATARNGSIAIHGQTAQWQTLLTTTQAATVERDDAG